MSKLIDLIGLTNIANDIRDWVNAHFLRKEEVPAGSTPSTTTPKMNGVASVGTENAFARGDHRHPSDTSKQDAIADLDDIRRGAAKGDTALQSESDPTVPSWAKQTNKPSYDYSEIGNTPDLSGFINKSVNDLTNYYLKSDTYTKAEVANLIGAISQFHYEIAASTSAVTDPKSNVLYLIGPASISGSDKYEENVYPDSTTGWVKIGDTSIDLSGYVTTSALNTALLAYTTTTDLNTLLGGYQTKIDSTHKLDYSLLDNTPTIPTVPTNVSAFSNDANYLKYHLCADETEYNAIQNKDNGTLYLIPES